MAPNGVEVRDLRVLRVYEERRFRWWLRAVDGLDAFPASYRGSTLTVSSGQGEIVARRRFKRNRDAEHARRRFVEFVAELSDDDYAMADWQTVLDSM
ncbi:MAG: hypothetical protein PV358_10390 [Acidimicrobiales bacterium]|nr:hypothetical protein [Acidimicrobiales bacterium]